MRSSLEPFLSGSETQKAKSNRMLTSRRGEGKESQLLNLPWKQVWAGVKQAYGLYILQLRGPENLPPSKPTHGQGDKMNCVANTPPSISEGGTGWGRHRVGWEQNSLHPAQ